MSDKKNISPQRLDASVGIDETSRLIDFVCAIAVQADMVERKVYQLHLVIEEALANVVNYSGATRMGVSVWLQDQSLCVAIDDDGKPFDPTSVPPVDVNVPGDERRIGGLGILYIRRMSDHMAYRREDGKNILTITKNL